MDPITQYRSGASTAVLVSRYMSRVYGWMTFGLMITAVVSYVLGTSAELMHALMMNRFAFILVIVAQFGLVIGLSAGLQRMSVGAATACFLLFSFVTGITFSSIFLAYSITTIGNVFAVTAASFAGLAIYGYVTKRDLSAMGTFMVMGLFGIIIASVVNFFLRSPGLDYALSLLSVVVFSGLTAWDVQKVKSFALGGDTESDTAHKIAIMGALSLYLDFINLFLALLRLFGAGERRR